MESGGSTLNSQGFSNIPCLEPNQSIEKESKSFFVLLDQICNVISNDLNLNSHVKSVLCEASKNIQNKLHTLSTDA